MPKIIRIREGGSSAVFAGSSCSFGVFDGVHRGHRFLVDQAIRTAAESGGVSVALTFSIDPDEMFAPDRLVKLMTNEERISVLAETGVDAVVVLPFDRDFASLKPEEFLDVTFGSNVPAHLHVGEGFRFGCKGAGDIACLKEWGARHGMEAHCHDLLKSGGLPVSSTRIRELLAQGRIDEAGLLLNRE